MKNFRLHAATLLLAALPLAAAAKAGEDGGPLAVGDRVRVDAQSVVTGRLLASNESELVVRSETSGEPVRLRWDEVADFRVSRPEHHALGGFALTAPAGALTGVLLS